MQHGHFLLSPFPSVFKIINAPRYCFRPQLVLVASITFRGMMGNLNSSTVWKSLCLFQMLIDHVCCSPLSGQIKLAEVEQASLMSEQLSDKSSSLALSDDLSLDEHSNYRLLVRDSQVLDVTIVMLFLNLSDFFQFRFTLGNSSP